MVLAIAGIDYAGWYGFRISTISAVLAFALGIAMSILYDRIKVRKKQIVYTITGYAQTDLHGF